MHVLELHRRFEQLAQPVLLYIPEGMRAMAEARAQHMQVEPIARHRKKFDIAKARVLAMKLRHEGVQAMFVFDNRDIGFAGMVKRMFHPNLKLIFLQQMQIGVNKRDLIHTYRFKALDAWVTPLESLQNEINQRTRFPSSRVHRIPLGIDTKRFTEEPDSSARAHFNVPKKGFVFGIIGRITRMKGQLETLKAFANLAALRSDVYLLIVGEPTIDELESKAYYHEIVEVIENHQLHKQVVLHGFSSESERFYKAIDVCIMASHSETYGYVTLESMCSGTPVIGADAGGTPELMAIGGCERKFLPGDASSLFLQMQAEISNHQELRSSEIKKVKEFCSIDREVDLLITLARNLTDK